MINHKPVIACYLVQYDVFFALYIFFISLNYFSSNNTAKQT